MLPSLFCGVCYFIIMLLCCVPCLSTFPVEHGTKGSCEVTFGVYMYADTQQTLVDGRPAAGQLQSRLL